MESVRGHCHGSGDQAVAELGCCYRKIQPENDPQGPTNDMNTIGVHQLQDRGAKTRQLEQLLADPSKSGRFNRTSGRSASPFAPWAPSRLFGPQTPQFFARLEELVEGALSDDSSVFHDDDLIGPAQG